MSRETYVMRDGKLVPKRLAAPLARAGGPMLVSDYAGYDCPITGKWIEGRAAHRENLARHGCRVLEPGETRDAMRNSEARYMEAQERVIDRALSSIAHQIDY